MRIGTVLKIAALLVVALLVAGVVVVQNMDFNQYKGLIAAKVKEATGRDLAINGDLKLNILTLSPSLVVNDVRFANAGWGSRPDMAVIERFEAEVALLPLISGDLVIQRIVLAGADILIETNKQGRTNLQFTESKPAAEPAPETGGEGATPSLPTLNALTIKDSMLTVRDAAKKTPLRVTLQTFTLDAAGPTDPLALEVKGSYNDAPFSADGVIGSLQGLSDPVQPWPVDLKARAGGAEISVDGRVAKPVEGRGIDLQIAVSGEDLSQFAAFTGSPLPAIGPYSLTAKLSGNADGTVALSDLKVKAGNTEIAGKAAATLGGKRPKIAATLTSDLIDLSDFTKATKGTDRKSAPAESGSPGASGTAAKGQGDGRLFPDDPLPVDALRAADAELDLSVKKIVVNGAPIENLKVALRLNDGDLRISPFSADVATGQLQGMLRLNGAASVPVLETKIDGKKIDLGKLLDQMQVTDLLVGTVNATVDLKGQGQSVHKIMAGLNGKTGLVMGQGKIKSAALDGYIGGATKIFTQLLAGKQSEYTVVNCFVSQFNIDKGIATAKPLVLDTEYASITGKGTINLGTEQLDLTVVPQSKSATINTAVPLQIGGTLTDPSYRLDPVAAARKLGGLVGAFAFPPAALLGLGELGAGDANPCVKQAKSGTPNQPQTQRPAQGGGEPLKNLGDSLEKGLKGLFGQ